MRVRGLNTSAKQKPHFERCFSLQDIDHFASDLDILVALLHDTIATNDLVDSSVLRRLNRCAILINGGRANCIVEPDLIAELDCGQLSHAVLDVMRQEPLPANHPLWRVNNLSITSHTSAPTRIDDMAAIFCDNYRRFHAGAALQHIVDFERGY